MVGTLGKRGTSASFQILGTLHSEKEVLRMSAMGVSRI